MITFRQGPTDAPPKFRPHQLVKVVGHINIGDIGMVMKHFTTDEFAHPEPYGHAYEVSLAGKYYPMTYYEHELEAFDAN